jgi:hypothetical protein
MYVMAGTLNADDCGAREPAVERGNTIPVTADPSTRVPGTASMSAN